MSDMHLTQQGFVLNNEEFETILDLEHCGAD